MYAGSLYFKEATGMSIYISSVFVLIITAVYVILGRFPHVFAASASSWSSLPVNCNKIWNANSCSSALYLVEAKN